MPLISYLLDCSDSENILAIRKPSIKALCSEIRGITPFSCYIMLNYIYFMWDFDSYRYRPIISCYFLYEYP